MASMTPDNETHEPSCSSSLSFPRIEIEGIPVDVIPDRTAAFERMVADIRSPGRTKIFSINIHAANIANRTPRFKQLMQEAHTMFCDGAGIIWASKLLPGAVIPARLNAADFLPALLNHLAKENLTAYFLAGEPGIAERAMARLSIQVPNHTVIGYHHGYILNDVALEQTVIDTINRLKPDILFVGFGMPLQEYWIDEHLDQLDVRAVFPFGATLDYHSQKVSRCPAWLVDWGFEWLFRFLLEPQRMFGRYIVGNPVFMSRILYQVFRMRLLNRGGRQPVSL